jgi:hypothetical protein
VAAPGYFFFGGFAFGGGELGWSPMTVFSGQTLNAGHFWLPATMAIGHRVMVQLLGGCARDGARRLTV